MEQIRSGEILFFANLKKQEEKRKQKKLKKEHALLNKKIGSMWLLFIRTLFSLYLLSWQYTSFIFIMLAIRSPDNSEKEEEDEDKALLV